MKASAPSKVRTLFRKTGRPSFQRKGHLAADIVRRGTDKGLEGAVMARGMLGMCVNGSLLQYVPEEADLRNATITFFADDQVFYSKVLRNEMSFRIPAETGYRWEVRIAGNINIKKIVMATSMDEMKAAT